MEKAACESRLSSRTTLFYKRWFPRLWLGLVALFVLVGIARILWMWRFTREDLVTVAAPAGLLVFGYLMFHWLLFDLVDEVVDQGNSLLVKNDGLEDHIALSNIATVAYRGFQSPQRITLTLREPCRFGTRVSFMPPYRIGSCFRHPVAVRLNERLQAS